MKEQWCIPPKANADFVYHMEDVLEVYKRPYDPTQPMVCMDEVGKQLVSETRQPLPAQPGQAQRYDYEYRREGVFNLFIFFEPLRGWRHLKVTQRRTRQDWAWAMKELVDVYYPDAQCITVVLDNLNTHTGASLLKPLNPPKHGASGNAWICITHRSMAAG